MNKIKKWLLWISIMSLVIYGLIYYTFFMLTILFIVAGLGYIIFKFGQKIIQFLNNKKF